MPFIGLNLGLTIGLLGGNLPLLSVTPPPSSSPVKGNGLKLSRSVIASAAKQSLFLQEIASSLTLLAMTAIP